MSDETNPKGKHGGKRPGAGRPRKQRAATVLDDDDVRLLLADVAPDRIESTAQRHARLAIAGLVKRLITGRSDAARVTAAIAILDRGYGKPAVEIGGDAPGLPFEMMPSALKPTAELRAEARKYANLAIEVLRRIAEFGQSETAVVAACKALLDRGLGTVGTAKLPEEFSRSPLGKKEAAARAAEAAATGRFATPAPPKGGPKKS